MKTGTLKELNVQPGDVVQVLGGKSWEIVGIDNNGNYLINDPPARHLSNTLPFRIISRAYDVPKLWRDMTDEEKGALLLSAHEGKVIQAWSDKLGWVDWTRPAWAGSCAYRVRPEPKRETVTMEWAYEKGGKDGYAHPKNNSATHRITFDMIDGEPDPASIRMDAI